MLNSRIIIPVVLFQILFLVNGQSNSKCVFQETCQKCLDADMLCAWCMDRNYDMRKPRCMTKAALEESNCHPDFIEVNEDKPTEIIKNLPPNDFDVYNMDATQIFPQEVKIYLNKLKSQTTKMTYKPAKNYPLDLYYLMDLTWSMKDDKETLVRIGGSLANALNDLTENYLIGFGSFADKPTMPFINIGQIDNPCAIEKGVCEPTYGFRHKLKMTQDISSFIEKVNSSGVTGNLDNLEGGLDALMQVLVCETEIGWRAKSRKIVVLASDGHFHYAGDGKLCGIIKPNDKVCHLASNGEYLGSLEYDYPSLGVIHHVLSAAKVNVIFAVTQDVFYYYQQMHQLIPELTRVEILKMDSSNILQLVRTGYNDVVLTAQFTDNSPDYVKVEYKSNCGGKYDQLMPLNSCDNIEIGKEYEFYIEVTLLEYPTDGTMNIKIKIDELSIGHESLVLDVDLRCVCHCDKTELSEKNSSLCSSQGEYKCGICKCNSGWTGKTCDCDIQDYESSKAKDNQCKNEANLGMICSNRGECFCGECFCNAGYDGKFCQCGTCPSIHGQECGGANNGFCDCGECNCYSGWGGEFCECSTETSTCLAPNNDKICSGKGTCNCGKCVCDPTYLGTYCEAIVGIVSNAVCSYYEPCVRCAIDRLLGNTCTDYESLCRSFKVEFNRVITSETNIQCLTRVKHKNATCDFEFTYVFDSKLVTVLNIEDKACPPASYAAIGAIVVSIATFLAGLLIIVFWKIHLIMLEKRDFAKFEKEQRNQTEYQMESPIYKSPVTHFKVPESFAEADFN